MVSWLTDPSSLKSNHTVVLLGLVRWHEHMAEGDMSMKGWGGISLSAAVWT